MKRGDISSKKVTRTAGAGAAVRKKTYRSIHSHSTCMCVCTHTHKSIFILRGSAANIGLSQLKCFRLHFFPLSLSSLYITPLPLFHNFSLLLSHDLMLMKLFRHILLLFASSFILYDICRWHYRIFFCSDPRHRRIHRAENIKNFALLRCQSVSCDSK